MFEQIRQDWEAHGRSAARHGFWVMVVYRFGRWRYGVRFAPARKAFSALYKFVHFFTTAVFGVELPCETVVGKGLTIEHPGAIVVSGDAVFGDDCILRQGVTVGLRHKELRGSPTIGDRCDIGAGAKLLGPIRIGDDCAIGANAVVLCDVPSNHYAVGIPARIAPRTTRLEVVEAC